MSDGTSVRAGVVARAAPAARPDDGGGGARSPLREKEAGWGLSAERDDRTHSAHDVSQPWGLCCCCCLVSRAEAGPNDVLLLQKQLPACAHTGADRGLSQASRRTCAVRMRLRRTRARLLLCPGATHGRRNAFEREVGEAGGATRARGFPRGFASFLSQDKKGSVGRERVGARAGELECERGNVRDARALSSGERASERRRRSRPPADRDHRFSLQTTCFDLSLLLLRGPPPPSHTHTATPSPPVKKRPDHRHSAQPLAQPPCRASPSGSARRRTRWSR
jgi:hypothetical protein